MLPTFIELGGGKVPDNLIVDGESITPLLVGKTKDSSRDWIMALNTDPQNLIKMGFDQAKFLVPELSGISNIRY